MLSGQQHVPLVSIGGTVNFCDSNFALVIALAPLGRLLYFLRLFLGNREIGMDLNVSHFLKFQQTTINRQQTKGRTHRQTARWGLRTNCVKTSKDAGRRVPSVFLENDMERER